tara:strand:- start:1350 stop:2330 length:981 start_codon:yes stop_codon:yes gene_type:complete
MKSLFFIFVSTLFFMANNASTSAFKDQEELDAMVVKYAFEGYGKVNAHWKMPGEGTGLSAYGTESIYWKPTANFLSLVVDYERCCGALPSVALTGFLESPTVADCRISMYAVMTYVLMKILGEDTFNALISEHEKTHKFLISSASTPLLKFTELRNLQYLWKEKNVGLFGYIHNVAYYGVRHPHGVYPGENVVITSLDEEGNPLYLGFPFDSPLSKTAIRSRLKDALEQEPFTLKTKETTAVRPERQKIYQEWMKSIDESYKKELDLVLENFDHLFEIRQSNSKQYACYLEPEAFPPGLKSLVGKMGEKLAYQFKLEKLKAFLAHK